jgi:hypothetical protein
LVIAGLNGSVMKISPKISAIYVLPRRKSRK